MKPSWAFMSNVPLQVNATRRANGNVRINASNWRCENLRASGGRGRAAKWRAKVAPARCDEERSR